MPVGKFLIVAGLFLIALGIAFTLAQKVSFPLGRLPGDLFIQKGRFSFYFPLATSLILSALLTLALNLLSRR